MNEKLDQSVIAEQKAMILNRIDQYETKKDRHNKVKPLIAIAAVLLLFMIPIFTQQSNTLGITQINANEYTLNLFGDKVHFRLYAFVENPNKVAITDEIGYDEGFQKYYDLTHQLTLEPLEIEGYLFLKVLRGEDLLSYLYVDTTADQARSVTLIDKSFDNFEAQMEQIIQNVKQYPYEITLDNERGPSVKEHVNAKNLSAQEYEDYIWFKSLQVKVYSSEPIDEYELILHFNGTKEDMGQPINVSQIIGRHSEELPFTFSHQAPSALSSEHEENGVQIKLTKYLFEDSEPSQWAIGAKIDYKNLNLEDYEISIKVNNQVIPPLTQLVDNQTVYLISDFLELTQNKSEDTLEQGQVVSKVPNNMAVEIQVTHKKTGQIITTYSDYHSMSTLNAIED